MINWFQYVNLKLQISCINTYIFNSLVFEPSHFLYRTIFFRRHNYKNTPYTSAEPSIEKSFRILKNLYKTYITNEIKNVLLKTGMRFLSYHLLAVITVWCTIWINFNKLWPTWNTYFHIRNKWLWKYVGISTIIRPVLCSKIISEFFSMRWIIDY